MKIARPTLVISLLTLAAFLAGSLLPLAAVRGQNVNISGSSTAGAVPTAFTYQGNLNKSGQPVNAVCHFQFTLWDALTDGAAQGTMQSIADLQVNDGAFSVQLDFGEQFTGQARFLQSAVKCNGEADYTTLAPRQPLRAVPYALSLRPGATIAGDAAPLTGVVTGRTDSPDGFGLHGDSADGYGVGGTGAVGVWGSGGEDGVGIVGTSDNGNGVYADSTNGAALRADSTNGVGVQASSDRESGIVGIAEADVKAGVYGKYMGQRGYGVRGEAENGVGVRAESANWIAVHGSSNGNGVDAILGEASGTDAVGVKGRATASGSVGVWGESVEGTAVYGHTTGDGARGVWGVATKPNSIGVYGVADNDLGVGVYGQSAKNTGVYGQTGTGNGVWGAATGAGFAMRADGHAAQSLGGGGWVKAMAYIDADNNVLRCYNSQLPAAQASVAPCDIRVDMTTDDVRQVDFGFFMEDRFVTVQAIGNPERFDVFEDQDIQRQVVGGVMGMDGTAAYVVAVASTWCDLSGISAPFCEQNGNDAEVDFMIFVY